MFSSSIYIFLYSSILLIKPKIFNISIDSSSLNILFIFITTLIVNKERLDAFLKIYDVLAF